MESGMSASDYLEQKLLNHVLRNTAFTQPSALYMALHTADPGDTGTANEVTGGSYARQTIAFGSVATINTPATNSGAVNFTSMPAVTVTHFSIQDASTSGNPLFIGPLTTPQTLTAGQTLTFAAGSVSVGAD
jgi:hypothetical protein